MKYLYRWIAAFASAVFFVACDPALAQQQVPDHAVPIGRGKGTGFKSAAPGVFGVPLISQGAASDPAFGAIPLNTNTVSTSGVVTIGHGVSGKLAPFTNNLNVYPINSDNGIQLGYGTGGGAGLGGSMTFFTKNTGGAPPVFAQELGFIQAYAWNGSEYNFAGAPLAIVFGTTEAWTPTANGSGYVFQGILRGTTSATGEISIAEGLTAMSASDATIVPGMGQGTINARNGTYDGGNRVVSASSPSIAINRDGSTAFSVINPSTGTSAIAGTVAVNTNGATTFGTAGSAYTGFSGLLMNKGVMLTDRSLDGLALYADGASRPIQFITNGTERARALLGFMVGTTTDPGAGAISATAAIKSSGATSGVGYATGAGGAVTQETNRTTGVTLNTVSGEITLVGAVGSTSWQSFTVTNSAVAATDTISIVQKSGADKNMIHITAVSAGSFEITFATTGGTTTEQPVFNFNVIKGVNS